jgi:transposase-like protein
MEGQNIFNRQGFYSEEMKLKTVQEVLSGQLTKAEASKRYGIRGHSRILTWIRKYEKRFGKDKITSYIVAENSSPMTEIEKAEFESIKRENDKLKQELTYASRRVIALETMIDVAEKELKINLRKKSSTRQSKRSDKEIK